MQPCGFARRLPRIRSAGGIGPNAGSMTGRLARGCYHLGALNLNVAKLNIGALRVNVTNLGSAGASAQFVRDQRRISSHPGDVISCRAR